jgi:hypothetical protein
VHAAVVVVTAAADVVVARLGGVVTGPGWPPLDELLQPERASATKSTPSAAGRGIGTGARRVGSR